MNVVWITTVTELRAFDSKCEAERYLDAATDAAIPDDSGRHIATSVGWREEPDLVELVDDESKRRI